MSEGTPVRVASERASGVVGYLTKRFPRLSETFILDEILGLEAQAVPLRLFSIRDPHERVVQPDVARVASGVRYLRPEPTLAAQARWATTVASCHVRIAAAHPGPYVRTLARALRQPQRRAALSHFVDAGRLSVELERAGAVHLHAAFAHSPAAIAHQVHLLTGIPFSFGGHAKDIYVSDPRHLALRIADAEFVVTCSASARDELVRLAGRAADRVRLVPHGVDVTRFRPRADGQPVARPPVSWRPDEAPAAGDPLRILAVGRLVEKKGYDVLLDALARLSASQPPAPFTCRIVGDGPLAGHLRNRAEALGIGPLVVFDGARPHWAVAEAYGDADVFVQASVVLPDGDRDGIPNVLLEAMASGLPVVATSVAGIPEAVADGETGLLVPGADPDALAAAIARLAADPGLRATLGRAARARVLDQFDRRATVRTMATLFGGARGARGLDAPDAVVGAEPASRFAPGEASSQAMFPEVASR